MVQQNTGSSNDITRVIAHMVNL